MEIFYDTLVYIKGIIFIKTQNKQMRFYQIKGRFFYRFSIQNLINFLISVSGKSKFHLFSTKNMRMNQQTSFTKSKSMVIKVWPESDTV